MKCNKEKVMVNMSTMYIWFVFCPYSSYWWYNNFPVQTDDSQVKSVACLYLPQKCKRCFLLNIHKCRNCDVTIANCSCYVMFCTEISFWKRDQTSICKYMQLQRYNFYSCRGVLQTRCLYTFKLSLLSISHDTVLIGLLTTFSKSIRSLIQ